MASHLTFAQKYITKTGLTEFKASVEAFEPVEATNNSSTAILKADNGQVAALLFIKAFHFKVALMEEHFNENYMDSDKFPKASFKGEILDFDISDLGKEEKTYPIVGTITIRGKSKKIKTPIQLQANGNKILAKATFKLNPADFGIEIPSIVRKKIAESITINFNYELIKKK
jgi:hypothetical protein